ncbi:hypothetical protein Ancab_017589 [Ancistrocladus abbreviatus]
MAAGIFRPSPTQAHHEQLLESSSKYAKFRRLSSMLPLLLALHLLLVSDTATSQFIIETLPGYPGKLPFKLETGYIGVGKSEEVQFFYYFVESERDPTLDPLLLWLTGGPGCSAFSGLVYEIGPLKFNYSDTLSKIPTFELNNNSWTKVASVIFVDAPVGTGFSYATTAKAYHSSDTLTAAHIYEFLRKWLLYHPAFAVNPLYISGDSYTGIIVPQVVQKTLHGNEKGKTRINLQGYVLGNPHTYIEDFNSRVTYAQRVSLISDELYESFMVSCDGKYVDAGTNNTQCARDIKAINDCISLLFWPQILEPNCSVLAPKPGILQWVHSTSEDKYLHFLLSRSQRHPELWCRESNYLFSYIWANNKLVQHALRVRKGTIKEWVRCNHSLSYTKDVASTVGYHRKFTKKYLRALVYSGDQDIVVPYVGTFQWIKSLKVPLVDQWRPWFLQGQVAGYTITYANLRYRITYATLKGAGLTAPEYKPAEALALVDRWFAHYPI